MSYARDSRLRSVATSACVLLSPGSSSQCRHALTATNAACQHSHLWSGQSYLIPALQAGMQDPRPIVPSRRAPAVSYDMHRQCSSAMASAEHPLLGLCYCHCHKGLSLDFMDDLP